MKKDLIRQLVYLQIDGAAKVTHESYERKAAAKRKHCTCTLLTLLAFALH